MRVAILGCGPAGLLAAHACQLRGIEATILSRKQKSEMFGAMYLHRSIPEITFEDAEFWVNVIKVGTREGYAKNVYGSELVPCSWDAFDPGPTPAWSLTEAYDRLWERYSDGIVSWEAFRETLQEIRQDFDLVISSIPAPSICLGGFRHDFTSQQIWVLVDPHPSSIHMEQGPLMYYNGYPSDGSGDMIGPSWYRFSLIGGISCWEYSHEPRPDVVWEGSGRYISWGRKPLRNTCSCYPEIVRVGRYGKWQKGVLTHHAFEDTLKVLDEML